MFERVENTASAQNGEGQQARTISVGLVVEDLPLDAQDQVPIVTIDLLVCVTDQQGRARNRERQQAQEHEPQQS